VSVTTVTSGRTALFVAVTGMMPAVVVPGVMEAPPDVNMEIEPGVDPVTFVDETLMVPEAEADADKEFVPLNAVSG
jgi:hypothetical protein